MVPKSFHFPYRVLILVKFIFKLKLYTICKIRRFYGWLQSEPIMVPRETQKIWIIPPFLVLSAMQKTSRQLDETSHNRYHTLSHLSLVQHSLPGSTTRTLSLGFCIDRHRQNHLLLALSCRQECSKVPHLLRKYLACLQLALYPK